MCDYENIVQRDLTCKCHCFMHCIISTNAEKNVQIVIFALDKYVAPIAYIMLNKQTNKLFALPNWSIILKW